MMHRKKIFWKQGLDTKRWQFWGWMMDHCPRLYPWCDKHLPFNTLPF